MPGIVCLYPVGQRLGMLEMIEHGRDVAEN